MTIESLTATQIHFERAAESYRQDTQSFFWGPLRRYERRQVHSLINEQVVFGDILDLGSGAGFYSEPFAKRAHRSLTCVDFSERMLEQIPFRCRRILANVEELPSEVTNRQYNLILCAGAFEFLSFPALLIDKVEPMLRVGGRFIFLAPRNSLLGKIYATHHARHGIKVALFTRKDILGLPLRRLSLVGLRTIPPFNWAAKLLKV